MALRQQRRLPCSAMIGARVSAVSIKGSVRCWFKGENIVGKTAVVAFNAATIIGFFIGAAGGAAP